VAVSIVPSFNVTRVVPSVLFIVYDIIFN